MEHIREGKHGARSTQAGDCHRAVEGAAGGSQIAAAEAGDDAGEDARAGQARFEKRADRRREEENVAKTVARGDECAEAGRQERGVENGVVEAGEVGGCREKAAWKGDRELDSGGAEHVRGRRRDANVEHVKAGGAAGRHPGLRVFEHHGAA